VNPKFAFICLLLVYVLAIAASSFGAEETLANVKKLAQAQNGFATDLYAQLRQQRGNFFFSPHSIAAAMSMTYLGAGGDTATEMAKVLHITDLHPESQDATLPMQTLLLERYAEQQRLFSEPQKDGLELHTANALWVKVNYPLDPGFVKGIRDSFNGTLESLDFGNETAASKKINSWVADQTNAKIQNLIAPGVLSRDTRLVLTNAIYFKAAWAEQFRKGSTKKEKFHVSAAEDVDVETMKRTGFFSLAELAGFRLLVIPYEKNQASLLVLLPDRVDALATVEKSITAEKLASWVEKSKSVRVALSLPKFKNTSSLDLNNALSALGIKKAFMAGQANFTGIANVADEPLYIGLVIHKAFVDVNEEGTEAAAATAAVMVGAGRITAEPVPFVADHPFVYIIRDNRTGNILFMGRLADPSRD
jgi:serpin B